MPYLLDTDSASLAFKGNERVRARIRQAPAPGVWLSGFYSQSLRSICEYRIHPYNEQAARVFASFSPQVKRIGSQDCRIAAGAIAAGWTVVTVNQKDFSRIPGVRFED